ncbi:MAG: hypothetical protein AB1742_16125 [bacterium]
MSGNNPWGVDLKIAETVGIVGVPPWEMMRERIEKGDEIVDLDEPVPGFPVRDGYLPTNYCAILKRVVSNIFSLREAGRLHRVIACVGDDKCDGMRHIARWLSTATDIPVERVRNDSASGYGTPICESHLPLRAKFELIVEGVFRTPRPPEPLRKAAPRCGFWGVPPADFDVLELFPDGTHVYGWTRCMENKTPGDFELECLVDPGVPTVFFVQSFCQKSALAFNLAKKHGGLFVEVDSRLSRSARAKIEAFIRFNAAAADTR